MERVLMSVSNDSGEEKDKLSVSDGSSIDSGGVVMLSGSTDVFDDDELAPEDVLSGDDRVDISGVTHID